MKKLCALFCFVVGSFAADVPAGFKLVYEQSFDKESALADFQMTDAAAWKFVTTDDGHGGSMELFQQSKYVPAVRSPFNFALIKDKSFGDFILECDLIQTGKEYGHRDMIMAFGFHSPTNFYYAPIATAADPHAHNVFIVDGAPRENFAKEITKGVNWGLNIWHYARLERTVKDGMIKVYFDDMTKPIMVAQNDKFKTGGIGFGSFDDTGRVDNIKIWAPNVEKKIMPPFAKE